MNPRKSAKHPSLKTHVRWVLFRTKRSLQRAIRGKNQHTPLRMKKARLGAPVRNRNVSRRPLTKSERSSPEPRKKKKKKAGYKKCSRNWDSIKVSKPRQNRGKNNGPSPLLKNSVLADAKAKAPNTRRKKKKKPANMWGSPRAEGHRGRCWHGRKKSPSSELVPIGGRRRKFISERKNMVQAKDGKRASPWEA